MKKWLAGFLMAVLLVSTCAVAFADEPKSETPVSDINSGSLVLECEVSKKPIDGVEFTLYRVASAERKYAGIWEILYDLEKPLEEDYSVLNYEGKELCFDGMTALESLKMAKKLDASVLPKVITVTSDKKGNANFGNLPLGMYLVVQTGAKGTAEHYSTYDPFLIGIPTDIDDEEIFNIICSPKTTIYDTDSDENTPPDDDSNTPPDDDGKKPPKTGDDFPLMILAGLGISAMGALIIVVLKRNREEEE